MNLFRYGDPGGDSDDDFGEDKTFVKSVPIVAISNAVNATNAAAVGVTGGDKNAKIEVGKEVKDGKGKTATKTTSKAK
jgi:hypothetical protein